MQLVAHKTVPVTEVRPGDVICDPVHGDLTVDTRQQIVTIEGESVELLCRPAASPNRRQRVKKSYPPDATVELVAGPVDAHAILDRLFEAIGGGGTLSTDGLTLTIDGWVVRLTVTGDAVAPAPPDAPAVPAEAAVRSDEEE